MANEIDLYQLFVLDLFGLEHTIVFVVVAFILFAVIASKFQIPNKITTVMLILFSLVLSLVSDNVAIIFIFLAAAIIAIYLSRFIGNRT